MAVPVLFRVLNLEVRYQVFDFVLNQIGTFLRFHGERDDPVVSEVCGEFICNQRFCHSRTAMGLELGIRDSEILE